MITNKNKLRIFLRIFALLTFLSPSYFFSQHICSLHPHNNDFNNNIGSKSLTTTVKAEEFIKAILAKIGLEKANFVVKPVKGIKNAVAFIYQNERYILFDEDYIENLSGENKNELFHFIFAHELAHHFLGHTLEGQINNKVSQAYELDCDRFAGYIFQKLGYKKERINTIFGSLPSPKSSNSSHPLNESRIKAAKIGFEKAENEFAINNSFKLSNGDLSFVVKEITNARFLVSLYYKNNNNSLVEEAIKSYQSANYQNKNALINSEIGDCYAILNDFTNAYYYYSKSFSSSRDLDLIYKILLCKINSEIALNNEELIQVTKIDYKRITDPYEVKLLSDYYYTIDYEKSIQILEFALNNNTKISRQSNLDKLNYIKLLNDYGTNFIKTDLSKAYNYLLKAKKDLDLFKTNFLNDEEITKTELNETIITVYGNFAMITFKLQNYKICLESIDQLYYENIKISIDQHYLLEYYKGFCLMANEKYLSAIESFSKVLFLNPNAYYVYPLRAECYELSFNMSLACQDWANSCRLLGKNEYCLKYQKCK